MSVFRNSPSSTIVNPDTNYGDNINLWTNTGNARDGSGATFAQVLNGADLSSVRYQTSGPNGQYVLIGMDIDWEVSYSGSNSTNSFVAVIWQKTAGVTLESLVLGNNFGAGPVRTFTTMRLLPTSYQQAAQLMYLTVEAGNPISGILTTKVYEIRFIYADRGLTTVTSG